MRRSVEPTARDAKADATSGTSKADNRQDVLSNEYRDQEAWYPA